MKKKRVPLTGIVVLVLLIIIAGGIWYWNTHKKGIIRNELESTIRKKSNGLYNVHYDKLELDEINGSLSVSSFSLSYDSIKYTGLQKENKEPYLVFNISIPRIEVTGVETPRALLEKEIRGRSLAILNPVIEILYTHGGKDSSRNVPDKEIYEQILGNLNLIKVDSVFISGAEIITKDLKSGKAIVRFMNTTISLLDVAVDSAANADTTRLLFAKEINLDCEKFSWQSDDKLYNYQVDSIAFRSAASTVRIKNFFVIPLLTEAAFVKSAPFQIDRLDFDIHELQFKNIDFFQLADEVIKADTLVIGSGSFKLYRDRNDPADNKNRVGTYPHQALQKLPMEVEIKKAIVKSSFVEYREKSPITQQVGKLQLGGVSGTINNITNRKEAIKGNSLMVLDIHSLLLNKIPLYTKWTFYLGHPDGRFDIEGTMGKAEAKAFNILAEPLGPARLEEGTVNSMKFNLAGTNYQMNGTLQLLYDDLKVSLLEKDKGSNTLDKKGLTSFLANIKIKNSNPVKNKEVRIARINYKRDTNKSIFNMAWKSLFEGVKEITGAK
jgi:hypothetical protein